MEEIRFVHLSEVNQQQIIDLMNNEMVGKQLPLLANGGVAAASAALYPPFTESDM